MRSKLAKRFQQNNFAAMIEGGSVTIIVGFVGSVTIIIGFVG